MTVADVSTPALVIGGVLASVLTALTSGYSAYRNARHEADVKDAGLVQGELERKNQRISDLEEQVTRWKSLAEALDRD